MGEETIVKFDYSNVPYLNTDIFAPEENAPESLAVPEKEENVQEKQPERQAVPDSRGDLSGSMPDTAVIERKMDLGIENFDDFTDPDELYKELIARVRKYHPSDDISVIEQAYKLALAAHKDQKRKSGEPYIIHPLSVAIILADLEMDKETIVAGILHDIVEDTEISIQEVEARFGHETAALVDGVTKLGELKYQVDKVEEQAENLRKMFLAMAKDIRVIIVKLADRLHNMRTLKYMTREKQKEKAEETLDIYAPIAQRLGISAMKVELDDLSLKYLDPEIYYKLVAEINEKREERQQYVDMIVTRISKNMEDAGIEATVKGRAKHFFSIYRKMVNQNKSIDQIYDLMAVRILVDSVKDCYAALGILHELYTPVPGRFKDYIAMPKPNMYQSLHNTLIGPTGKPFEVQIRTYDMHRIAEYGIAAHWKYKEVSDGKTSSGNQEEEKMNWLRQILEWQQDMSDNKEFMNLLKSDLNLFTENVYVFSPAGDVKTLPAGSCPIDFAYMIHSAVGNTMVGARVNGKLVPIETKLKNGDRVEIITSQNSRGPSRDWLKVVKSPTARNRINRWFRNESRETNIQKGSEMLAGYARSKGRSITPLLKQEYMDAVVSKYGFHDWESVLAAIGHGGLREGQVLNRLIEMYERDHYSEITDEDILNSTSSSTGKPAASHKGSIVVHGAHDVAVRFSKCCNPIPGDEIVGYVTRGRGVTIHRTDCVNVINMPESERGRLIEAEWQADAAGSEKFLVSINIYTKNRTGIIVDISKVLTERKIDIKSLNARVSKHGTGTFEVAFEVDNTEELKVLASKLRQVEGVIDIERTKG